MNDREFIAVFHYDNGGTNRCGAEPYRYAEEIVRCKECKHSPKNTKEIPLHDSCYTFNPNDYCSYGEVRDE